MIEDKEAYRKKRSEIMDRQEELIEKIDMVDAVKELLETYDCSIEDLKERLENELAAADDEYQEYTKEESQIFAKICKEFSGGQIEQWFAQGYDTVDLVNAYLGGDLDKFREKK